MNYIKNLKTFLKSVPGVKLLANKTRKYIRIVQLKFYSPEKIFTKIYNKRSWGGVESVSGTGSGLEQTRVLIDTLPSLFSGYNISTILDIPCGDFNWMKNINLGRITYYGGDIVREIIRNNIIRYPMANLHFMHLDVINDNLPKVDLIICRDCLVHFSYKDVFNTLRNICNSNAQYLLTTTFTNRNNNTDIYTGQWRPLNLQIHPFCLPEPEKLINENYQAENGLYLDKSLALWKIDVIRNHLSELIMQNNAHPSHSGACHRNALLYLHNSGFVFPHLDHLS